MTNPSRWISPEHPCGNGRVRARFGGNGRGDLKLRIQVHIPEQLSNRERRLYEELNGLKKKGV